MFRHVCLCQYILFDTKHFLNLAFPNYYGIGFIEIIYDLIYQIYILMGILIFKKLDIQDYIRLSSRVPTHYLNFKTAIQQREFTLCQLLIENLKNLS